MYNLQSTMAKHNLQVEPVLVMSLCKPSIDYVRYNPQLTTVEEITETIVKNGYTVKYGL